MEPHQGSYHELLSEPTVQNNRSTKSLAQKLRREMATESIFHFHNVYGTAAVPSTTAS